MPAIRNSNLPKLLWTARINQARVDLDGYKVDHSQLTTLDQRDPIIHALIHSYVGTLISNYNTAQHTTTAKTYIGKESTCLELRVRSLRPTSL